MGIKKMVGKQKPYQKRVMAMTKAEKAVQLNRLSTLYRAFLREHKLFGFAGRVNEKAKNLIISGDAKTAEEAMKVASELVTTSHRYRLSTVKLTKKRKSVR